MKFAVLILTFVVSTGVLFGAGNAKEGKASYDKACKSCHGADGTPNPAVMKMMKVEMKHLGDPEVQAQSDDKHTDIIKNGVGKMKPIRSLNDTQIADVVAFIKTLKK